MLKRRISFEVRVLIAISKSSYLGRDKRVEVSIHGSLCHGMMYMTKLIKPKSKSMY